MSARWLAAFLTCAGCTCRGGLDPLGPAELGVLPMQVRFPDTWVGQRRVATVVVTNRGGASAAIALEPTAPFTATPPTFEVRRGESVDVELAFAPGAAGTFQHVLRVGPLEVAVEGTGLAVPACLPSRACVTSQFDVEASQCREAPLSDDSACATKCVTGTCQAGTCAGQAISCDDGDLCTVDLCGEAEGCGHAPLQCPAPPGKCQTARCDPQQGCLLEAALDGTLCGEDDCLSTNVDVCLAGQCTRKPRPADARCTNRWVPATLAPRYAQAMAYDSARRKVVLFGGAQSGGLTVLGDTWEWDGVRWRLLIPAASPAARQGHAMAYDATRRRVVLFGGYDGANYRADTWEWDGTTWLARLPLVSPPVMRWAPSMAWDAARQRIVLFGTNAATSTSETWEWNGSLWTQRTPAMMPSPRTNAAMAYDVARQRVVLFGGSGGSPISTDTWEWDGTSWFEVQTTLPAPSEQASMAWDAVRQRLVLLTDGSSGTPSKTYEWTAAGWLQRGPATTPTSRAYARLAWDGVRAQVMLLGGRGNLGLLFSDTWEWDGTTWALVTQTDSPSPRTGQAMAYDVARGRLVLFGGTLADSSNRTLSDTWEWSADGGWLNRAPPTTPLYSDVRGGMAYDTARQRTVMGGASTWEWDGADWTRLPVACPGVAVAYDADAGHVVALGRTDAGTAAFDWDGAAWTRRPTTDSPPQRFATAAAYDLGRQQLVMFGGRESSSVLRDTWELSGATWKPRSPVTSPSARGIHTMAYDASRSRVVLLGGWDGFTSLGDTWEWDGAEWRQAMVVSSPPAQFSGSMSYDTSIQRVVYFGASLFILLP